MHRCHGASNNINTVGTRAVTKLKATVTQNFEVDDTEFDVETDCGFYFFFEKIDGHWGARLVRHWYEKDKMIPTNPAKFPALHGERLKKYPLGYKYLAPWQEITMGVTVLQDLPGHGRHTGAVNVEKHDLLYRLAKGWLEGGQIDS